MAWISRIDHSFREAIGHLKCLHLIKCLPPSLITDHTLVTLAISCMWLTKVTWVVPSQGSAAGEDLLCDSFLQGRVTMNETQSPEDSL